MSTAPRFRGNSTFKRLPGATGPTPDLVYNLYSREETWEGQTANLGAFLSSYPLGVAHPTYSYLKLAEYRPTAIGEGGVSQVWLRYTGAPSSPTATTLRGTDQLKNGSAQGRLVVNWTLSNPPAGSGLNLFGSATTWANTPISFDYLSPAVTIRYSSSTFVKNGQFQTLASQKLGNSNPTLLNVTAGSATAGSVTTQYQTVEIASVSYYFLSNLSTPISLTSGAPGPLTPILQCTDVSCEQKGSWFEVDETWALELHPLAAGAVSLSQ
jgi:hypothetical protein